MNILLWKIGALGDVLMTTPLVRQLRRALPRARIDYLTGASCAAVVEGNPHLDSVLRFDEQILYRAQAWRLHEVLARLRGYDAILVLDKHWVFSVLARAARIPVRAGFSRRGFEGAWHTLRVPYGPLRHEIHYYLDLAEAFGQPVDRTDLRLELPAPTPYPLQGPAIVLANSGGANAYETSQARRMPDDLFAGLVAQCAQHARCVFLGTSQERGYYERMACGEALNLCGHTDLRQAWSVLSQADAVYSTDSGLMHMAAAVNPNVVAVFGPTHPLRKCPPGTRWVWKDETLYDPAYEVFGRAPRGSYFRTLQLEDILLEPQVNPLDGSALVNAAPAADRATIAPAKT